VGKIKQSVSVFPHENPIFLVVFSCKGKMMGQEKTKKGEVVVPLTFHPNKFRKVPQYPPCCGAVLKIKNSNTPKKENVA